jgi:hypothetical protein
MYFQDSTSLAASGWKARPDDYEKIIKNKLTEAYVERQITRKWKTKDHTVAVLKTGRSHIRREHYSLVKIKELFKADNKLCRDTYDSYQLILDNRMQPSRAWTVDEFCKLLHKRDRTLA